MNLKHLYWRYFGYPDLPPKSFKLTFKTKPARRHLMTRFYLHRTSIETIATRFNVTRERVRQCIWKCYWETYKN